MKRHNMSNQDNRLATFRSLFRFPIGLCCGWKHQPEVYPHVVENHLWVNLRPRPVGRGRMLLQTGHLTIRRRLYSNSCRVK